MPHNRPMPDTRHTPGATFRQALGRALCIAACGLGSAAGASEPQGTPHPLVGRWKVASIHGAPPPKFLAGQVLVIQADGQVINLDLGTPAGTATSEGAVQKAMREALTRGTWRADKARLYVSNSPRRDTGSAYRITQQGALLSLDPDPYYADAGEPSQATYQRLP